MVPQMFSLSDLESKYLHCEWTARCLRSEFQIEYSREASRFLNFGIVKLGNGGNQLEVGTRREAKP